jgi:hypothetical protein
LIPNLSVFGGSTHICFSRELKSFIAVRKVIEIISNHEDKVVYKRVALIGSQLRIVGQNNDTGKYLKERELGDVAKGVVVGCSQVGYRRMKER